MTAEMKKPDSARNRASDAIASYRALYGKAKFTRLPDQWRDHLPDPASYYAERLAKLGRRNQSGWAQALCPFHDDRDASLSVNLDNPRGGFRCFACGEHGDMVRFHEKTTGLRFPESARDLLGVRR